MRTVPSADTLHPSPVEHALLVGVPATPTSFRTAAHAPMVPPLPATVSVRKSFHRLRAAQTVSQDSPGDLSHRSDVTGSPKDPPLRREVGTRQAIDPAARTGKRAYNALSASSVGLELGLSVAIGLFVGYYMDQWLGTQPWMLLLWLVFGLAAGFRGVFRAINRADRAAEEESRG